MSVGKDEADHPTKEQWKDAEQLFWSKLAKAFVPSEDFKRVEIAIYAIELVIYTAQIIWVFKQYGRLIQGWTRFVLIFFWVYMATNLIL